MGDWQRVCDRVCVCVIVGAYVCVMERSGEFET